MTGILRSNGQQVVTYTYDAWGKQLSYTGSTASTLGALNPLRYRGYVYDQETSLYYLQSRYYNPEWGRFINADNYPTTGQGFTGNNMFAYCGNNPVSRIDVSGEFFNTICGTLVSGFVAAFTRSDKESFGQAFARGAVTGAIAGAALDISIATAGAGAIAIAAIGGATAAVLDYSWEQTNKAESINAGEMVLNATIGAGMNALFGAAGREVTTMVGNSIKSIGKAIVNNTIKSVTNSAGKVIAKKLTSEIAKNTASAAIQGGFSKIFSLIGSKMLGGLLR